MAKNKPAAIPSVEAEAETAAKTGVFVLKRNFGRIVDGVHHFWEAGTEIDPKAKADLLSFLAREGAELEQL